MFRFFWNCFAVVGVVFTLTVWATPGLIPDTVAVVKSYYNRAADAAHLVWEEWQRD